MIAGANEDPRLAAARYRVAQGAEAPDGEPVETPTTASAPPSDGVTREQLMRYAEVAVEQAIRRGDFDDLPGSGKPLADLHQRHDPDWWIRRKIEREKLTGLGPPALTLRTEDAQLDSRLDAMTSEQMVRSTLEDFNRRVIEARRQLQGGPPVVTPTRDVDSEVLRWHERAGARRRDDAAVREREATARAAMSWRERRRARRKR